MLLQRVTAGLIRCSDETDRGAEGRTGDIRAREGNRWRQARNEQKKEKMEEFRNRERQGQGEHGRDSGGGGDNLTEETKGFERGRHETSAVGVG